MEAKIGNSVPLYLDPETLRARRADTNLLRYVAQQIDDWLFAQGIAARVCVHVPLPEDLIGPRVEITARYRLCVRTGPQVRSEVLSFTLAQIKDSKDHWGLLVLPHLEGMVHRLTRQGGKDLSGTVVS